MKCEHPNEIALYDRDIDCTFAWYCPTCGDVRMVARWDKPKWRGMATDMVIAMNTRDICGESQALK